MISDLLEWSEDHLPSIETVKELVQDTTGFLRDAGINSIAYFQGGIDAQKALSNFPTVWKTRYVAEALCDCDPVFRKAVEQNVPVIWEEAYAEDQGNFKDMAQHAGVPPNGITVTVSSMRTVLFTVAGDISTRELTHRSRYLPTAVELLAKRFDHRLTELERGKNGLHLSPREQEVLQWAARGKSAWETAQILCLTEGTVGQYIHAAARKLETCNKAHTVTRAIEENLI